MATLNWHLRSFGALTLVSLSNAQSWNQVCPDGFGNPGNLATSLYSAEYNGLLFVGTANASGCEIWSFDGSTCNSDVVGGFGDQGNLAASSLATVGGWLYAGTFNDTSGCEVWRRRGAAGWTRVGDLGFGDRNNTAVLGIAEHEGSLHVGTENRITGCEIWVYDDIQDIWSRLDGPPPGNGGFGDPSNVEAIGMVVYDGLLYVGTHHSSAGCQLWEYDGANWTQRCPDGFGDVENEEVIGMAVHGSSLFIGTTNETTGCEVWQFEGDSCAQVNVDGFGIADNDGGPGLVTFGGRLYAGTWNETTGCEFWRYEGGTDWERVDPGAPGPGNGGFGDGTANYATFPLGVYADRLFTGTSNDTTGCEVWELVPEGVGDNYCSANANSTGVIGVIGATGSDLALDNDISLIANQLPLNQFGYFLTSETQGFVANPGGSDGNLCLAQSIGRYNRSGEIQSSGAGGSFSLSLDLTDTPQPNGAVHILAGETWNFQGWYRDVSGGNNFTDAISITFQ